MRPPDKQLVIDGYNVVHAWTDLKARVRRGGMEAACKLLGDRVRVIHDVEAVRVTLVYDGRGDEIQLHRPGNEITFSILYTPDGLSADSLIEQIVARRRPGSDCWVASDDNLVRASARAAGGLALTAQDLLDWVERCEKQRQRKLERTWKQNETAWRQRNPWQDLQ